MPSCILMAKHFNSPQKWYGLVWIITFITETLILFLTYVDSLGYLVMSLIQLQSLQNVGWLYIKRFTRTFLNPSCRHGWEIHSILPSLLLLIVSSIIPFIVLCSFASCLTFTLRQQSRHFVTLRPEHETVQSMFGAWGSATSFLYCLQIERISWVRGWI